MNKEKLFAGSTTTVAYCIAGMNFAPEKRNRFGTFGTRDLSAFPKIFVRFFFRKRISARFEMTRPLAFFLPVRSLPADVRDKRYRFIFCLLYCELTDSYKRRKDPITTNIVPTWSFRNNRFASPVRFPGRRQKPFCTRPSHRRDTVTV